MAEYIDRKVAIAYFTEPEGIRYMELDGSDKKYTSEQIREVLRRIPASRKVIEKDAATINGYPMEKLWAFARMCEEMDVTNDDLKKLCHNMQFVHDAYLKEQQMIFNKCIEQFCTDIPVAPLHLPHEEEKDE